MDQSALTRRRLLELAVIGLGASALTACTEGLIPVETSPPAATVPPAPLTVRTSAGSFDSAYRPGVATHWSLAAPDMPPGNPQPELPVVIFLHGLGGDHSVLLENLAADEALQRHLDAGGAPFAIAAVDGGDNWWHPRANGTDTQSMLVREFAPFLGRRGYDLGRIGLLGLSMGGFGALLLASQGRLPGVRAVAAMSPAVWEAYDPRLENAFDGPADFAPPRVRAPARPRALPNGSMRHRDDLAATVRLPRRTAGRRRGRLPARRPRRQLLAFRPPTCCPSWAATSAEHRDFRAARSCRGVAGRTACRRRERTAKIARC
jgi:pimeloyl-ACP methyl ester carboxylesterase